MTLQFVLEFFFFSDILIYYYLVPSRFITLFPSSFARFCTLCINRVDYVYSFIRCLPPSIISRYVRRLAIYLFHSFFIFCLSLRPVFKFILFVLRMRSIILSLFSDYCCSHIPRSIMLFIPVTNILGTPLWIRNRRRSVVTIN